MTIQFTTLLGIMDDLKKTINGKSMRYRSLLDHVMSILTDEHMQNLIKIPNMRDHGKPKCIVHLDMDITKPMGLFSKTIQLIKSDIATLTPDKWIEGFIVDAWGIMLRNLYPHNYYVGTQWYIPTNKKSIKKTKMEDVQKLDFSTIERLIIPCFDQNHWFVGRITTSYPCAMFTNNCSCSQLSRQLHCFVRFMFKTRGQ